jgi:hypothetical protein
MPVLVATRSKAWVWGRSLAGIGVRISPPAWTFVCCECCVLSGRGLCVGPITLPDESYRERERERESVCVCVCARARAVSVIAKPRKGVEAPQEKKMYKCTYVLISSVLNVWVMHNLEILRPLNIS